VLPCLSFLFLLLAGLPSPQRSAKLLRHLARWAPVKVLHGPLNAVVAAATAESTSGEDASSTWPTREPVLGE
jgi:hypothetical protein